MILLEELKSKVDLLSVGMLKACANVPHLSDIATLTLSKNTKAGIIKVIYHSHYSHLLYSDKRLMTLLDYLEEAFKLSEIQSVTYYIPSKKIVFTFNKNRIYIDPKESIIELSNFTKGIKRKLPKNSIKVQLDLLELLFKDTVNSLSKSKNNTIETYKTSDSFRRMVESVNNVVSLNRNYMERVRDIPIHNNRVWGPRTTFPNVEYAHPQQELVERYNLERLGVIQNTPISIDEHTTFNTAPRPSINTEQLQALLRATEDADATATAIRFAENYL